MEKLKKLIPEKIQITGHRVIVSEKAFDSMVTAIDAQNEVINQIIDCLTEINTELGKDKSNIRSIKTSVGKLANALKTYMEE